MADFKQFSEIYSSDDSLSKFRSIIEQADVLAQFDQVFPDLKRIAKPVKVEKNILYLTVVNSVWKSELKFKQKLIIDKINTHFNKPVVRSVRFI